MTRLALLGLISTVACTEIRPSSEPAKPAAPTSAVALPVAKACELAATEPAAAVVPGTADPYNVAVAGTGERWLVAYQRQQSDAEAAGRRNSIIVYGRIFDKHGLPVTGELVLSGKTGFFVTPTVIASEGRFLVAWIQELALAGVEDPRGASAEARWVGPDGALSPSVTWPIDALDVGLTAVPGGVSVLWEEQRISKDGNRAVGATVKRLLLNRELAPTGPDLGLLDTAHGGVAGWAELPLAGGGSLVAIASPGFRNPRVNQIHLVTLDKKGTVTSAVVELASPHSATFPRMLQTDHGILLGWSAVERNVGGDPNAERVHTMVAMIDSAGKVLREPKVIGESSGRFGGPELQFVRGIPSIVFDAGKIQQLTETGEVVTAALKVPPAEATYGWYLGLGNAAGIAWRETHDSTESVHFAPIGCKTTP